MLSLIGLGLYDEKDLSVRAKEEIEDCDLLFMEKYTSKWEGQEELEEMIEKKIDVLERSQLEENFDEILKKAEEKRIGILIPGDPLVATTHIELLIQARRKEIKTKVVHSSSIYSAVAETGLQIYKFGKTTTIPYPEDNYRPESPYYVIKENREMGLHTLVLLDVKPDKAMEVCEAISYLLQLEKEKGEDVIDPNETVVAFSVKGKKTHLVY
ncbi:MAG: diphthine synthase, partial [Candidatus Aenigmatarchaeota archaeon]